MTALVVARPLGEFARYLLRLTFLAAWLATVVPGSLPWLLAVSAPPWRSRRAG